MFYISLYGAFLSVNKNMSLIKSVFYLFFFFILRRHCLGISIFLHELSAKANKRLHIFPGNNLCS